MKKKSSRRRVEVDVEELDRIIDDARSAPLSESDSQKLKTALHALAERLLPQAKTEKTSAVFGDAENPTAEQVEPGPDPAAGHGRNAASAYHGAHKVRITHPNLVHGGRCPDCSRGNVYCQKEPKALLRIVGQAPLAATVYELERLRCNACGQVFTAAEPEGVGPEKYDETAAAMIAQLKYGSGIPFYRLETLEEQMGIPLPAATQWEIVEEAAETINPAHEELIRQAAQGEVLHNDDTGMRVLRMEREPSDERTGVFTSGIVSTRQGRNVALYFTGRRHAGENIADVLMQRVAELSPPIQMSDALWRNLPKPTTGVEILLANCLAHGRRQFVEVAANFPVECRYVLEDAGPGVR
jgi:transposase